MTNTLTLHRKGIDEVEQGDVIFLDLDDDPREVDDLTYVDDDLFGAYVVVFIDGSTATVGATGEVFEEVED